MKERIIQEFTNMLATLGVKAVTMNGLAIRLGISKKTLYEIFTDKDHLLEVTLHAMIEQKHLAYETLTADTDNVLEAMVHFVQHGVQWLKDYRPDLVREIQKYHYPIYEKVILTHYKEDQKNIQTLIETGIVQGVFRRDLNPEILSLQIHSTFFMISSRDIFPPERFFYAEVMKEVLLNIVRGLCSENGLALIRGYMEKHTN